MIKKENIVWVLFPFIWIFYFSFMKGHIGYWEETDFFLWTNDYWNEFLWKPGGWSDYLGFFLRQFYQWLWLGALILVLIPLGIFLLIRGVMRKLEMPANWIIVATVPVILICCLQCQQQVGLGETLKILFFFLFFRVYLSAPHSRLRYLFFSIGFPVAFLVLSGGGCIMLYATCILYEIWKAKGWGRWEIALFWSVLVAMYPLIWSKWIYVVPFEKLYVLSVSESAGYSQVLLWMIYLYGIFLLGISWGVYRIHQRKTFVPYYCRVFLVFMGWGIGMYVVYPKESEYFLRMEQAVEAGKWDEVLQMAQGGKEPGREEMYCISLALANKGELGERLFEYLVWGLECLYLPRQMNYTTSALGSEFYFRLNIPNEALHWTFQASVASPQGMNFRILKRLIDLNTSKGDRAIADKYLTILEHTVCYATWCRQRRVMLENIEIKQVKGEEPNDFFIGGRPFLSDMARILDAGKSQKMVLDYILSGLLLNKDLKKFCYLFTTFYQPDGKRIPKAYQEALVVAGTVGDKTVLEKNYSIDPEIIEKFKNYNALSRTCGKDKEQAKVLMKEFKYTWWYYFHFVEPRPIDQQGYVLDKSSAYSS